jgi:hypothetical protein
MIALQEWHRKQARDKREERDIKPQPIDFPIAFKSSDKQEYLTERGYFDRTAPRLAIPQNFPLKAQKKIFGLHHVSPYGTYQVDMLSF